MVNPYPGKDSHSACCSATLPGWDGGECGGWRGYKAGSRQHREIVGNRHRSAVVGSTVVRLKLASELILCGNRLGVHPYAQRFIDAV